MVGRLTLVPGGRRVSTSERRGGEAVAADVSRTWVLRAVIVARRATRPGTSGAQRSVRGRAV